MTSETTANRSRIAAVPTPRPIRHGPWKPTAKPPWPHRGQERFAALDNARFVLIALVVVGHLLERLVDAGPVAEALYRFIYLFHMPAFVLISGALAKPALNRRRLVAIGTALLLPYFVFQTLYPAWDAWLNGSGDWFQGYATPYWLLWYLPSLACWRLLLPVADLLRRWALPAAVAVALGAGLVAWIGYPFSASRTLVFFPLFVLGNRIGPSTLQRLGASRACRWAAMAILAGAAVAAWWLRDADPRWLYASFDYADLGTTPATGAGVRLGLLAASALCALAVVTLVSRRPRWDGAGRRSLNTYLLHGFLVLAAAALGVFAWLAATVPTIAAVAICAAAGFVLARLLSTRGVDRFFAPLLQPARWLQRRRNPSG